MKYHIHTFRNALATIIETQSYRYCELPRWQELNAFPYGSCDLANNMLAMYLREHGYNPKMIWCRNDLADYPEILSHVWVEVDNKFVDITINQFPRLIRERVHIANKYEVGILNEIYFHCREKGQFEEREVDLRNHAGCGDAIYQAVAALARKLSLIHTNNELK
ncbi:hypothetical protein [Photobacterium gaetbulicola]|uniref:hypothetical protein n=1 Tax=Photobacterium gaetbulicola TaxID=1295392 RepID=UPI000AA48564|nr:hypothetical protein [Photobacterium gaetbulicola]